MASTNTIRVEVWTTDRGTDKEATAVKIAVRNHLGQFHGATNFRTKEPAKVQAGGQPYLKAV